MDERTSIQDASPSGARVPEGSRVYAIGDIHGCVDKLEALHHLIAWDTKDAPPRRVLVYLGDLVDRGPDPRGAIDLLLEAPLEGFERVVLLGNHEAFMLRFLRDPEAGPLWLANGGAATCRSYGADPDASPGGADRMAWLRGELVSRLPAEHRAFLEGLARSHVEGGYLFVHAGIRPEVPLDRQDPEDLLWIREPFLGSDLDHGKVVVHGHTPTDRPVVRANRIGIDTGACYGGRLTALVLEGDRRRFLEV